MCGRFTLTTAPKALAKLFQFAEPPGDDLRPRYNIAPTQTVTVVGLKPDGATRGLRLLRWGLIPHWVHDPKSTANPINARAEGIANKPMFADLIRFQRCLVPADGFYEWATRERTKQPYHIRRESREPFAFAGLWDSWVDPEGKKVLTCCIITTTANELMKPIHDRMPVILQSHDFRDWLAADSSLATLVNRLRPYDGDDLEAIEVSSRVNKATNEGPECLTPA